MLELDEILKKLENSRKKLPKNPKEYNDSCKDLKKYEDDLFISYDNIINQITSDENPSDEAIACQKELKNWALGELKSAYDKLSKCKIEDSAVQGFMKRLEVF